MQEPAFLINSCYFAGLSWFMNCLIELQIRVEEQPEKIFKYKAAHNNDYSEYSLRHTVGLWKASLPSLMFNDKFLFRNDQYCVFLTHDFLTREIEKYRKTLVFIRDPRDVLFTTYHYGPMGLNFHDWFLAQHHDLNWGRLVTHYLGIEDKQFFKFEDYKANPSQQLKNLLHAAGIKVSEQQMARALENSSYEKAKEGEKAYKDALSIEQANEYRLRNRSGKVGQWRSDPNVYKTMRLIEESLAPLMKMFGYEPELL